VSLQEDARPGQARLVFTPDVIAAVDGHIRANRRIGATILNKRQNQQWTAVRTYDRKNLIFFVIPFYLQSVPVK
jgi:hypothetical protein